MNAVDLFAFARRALSGHRRRSLLTLLGVAIGVAAVVLLVSLGEGVRRFVTGQFASLGSNLLAVIPGRTETTGAIPGLGGAPHDLTLEDADAVRRGVPAARQVAPLSMGNDTVEYRSRSRQTIVLGSTPELLGIRDLSVTAGRFLPASEGAPVVVLGRKLARELFAEENPVGRVVRIGSFRLRVRGVLAAQGMHLGFDMDDAALVPVGTGMRIFDRTSLFRILLRVASPSQLEGARARAVAILTERHGEEDVTCVTQESIVASLGSILDTLTLALAGIAAISLTVAGLGVMNVMLVAVAERAPEVGLLRAVGARRGQVLLVFLAEAVLLSTAGGLLGLAASAAAAAALARAIPAIPSTPPAWAVACALGVSVGVGALFGLLPASRAARLDPAAVLARR